MKAQVINTEVWQMRTWRNLKKRLDYSRAIELDPNDADAYNNRANVKGKLGQHEEAIKDFNKAIELEPGNTGLHHNQALEYGRIEVEKTSAKVKEA